MLKKVNKNSKGFTLIEIVIVLAIGALIILVVIQAIGAARRSQRDNARKQESGRIASIMEQYASNNNGQYPANAAAAQSALTTYDATLGSKYPTFTSGTAPTSCPSIDPSIYTVVYDNPNATTLRSYTMYACLEAGVDNTNYGVE